MNIKDVKKTQDLAKLKLERQRFNKISNNISEIISYVDILQNANTTNLPETFNASGITNVSAEDKPIKQDNLTQQQAIKNAKRSYKGYIQVNKVI